MLKLSTRILALALALGVAACAQAPDQDIAAAKAAIEDARAIEKYAPESFRQAQDALNAATAEIEAQNGKFALFRSYDQAKELLAKAKDAAASAKKAGEAKREEVKKAAEALMTEAQAAIDAAKSAVATAPKGKGTDADFAAMKTDLESYAATLGEAQGAFGAGDYLTAQTKADSVKTQAGQISADIAQAKAKKAKR